jgi:hypothetical protein
MQLPQFLNRVLHAVLLTSALATWSTLSNQPSTSVANPSSQFEASGQIDLPQITLQANRPFITVRMKEEG